MKYNLYSIYDKCAGTFTNVQIQSKDEIAKRSFQIDFAKSPYKKDLALYRLGTYDIETGKIESNVEFLCNYEAEAGGDLE